MNALIDALAPLLVVVVTVAYALRVRTLAARGRPVELRHGYDLAVRLGTRGGDDRRREA